MGPLTLRSPAILAAPTNEGRGDPEVPSPHYRPNGGVAPQIPFQWSDQTHERLLLEIMDLQQGGGGALQVEVTAPDALRASVNVVRLLATELEMAGLVVSPGRPERILHRALDVRRCAPLPTVIDLATPLLHGQVSTSATGGPTPDPFDLPGVLNILQRRLDSVARTHGGESYYVVVEDLQPLRAYNSDKAVLQFAQTLAARMSAIGCMTLFLSSPPSRRPLGRRVRSVALTLG